MQVLPDQTVWEYGNPHDLPTNESVYAPRDTDPEAVGTSTYVPSGTVWDAFNDDVEEVPRGGFEHMSWERYGNEGILPSGTSRTLGEGSARQDPLPAHLYRPPREEVTQEAMRGAPMPEPNTMSDRSFPIYLEAQQRLLENGSTIWTQGHGALDTYSVTETGDQVETFADGEVMTRRFGGYHPRTRIMPVVRDGARFKPQYYGRLGNAEARGRVGSVYSENTSSLGSVRVPRNAEVREREAQLPIASTGAGGNTSAWARPDDPIVRGTQRQTTCAMPYFGTMGSTQLSQEALRLKDQQVRSKLPFDFKVQGTAGASYERPGGYVTADFEVLATKRQVENGAFSNALRPGNDTERVGAYATAQYDVLPTLRSTTSGANINMLRPGRSDFDGRPGGYVTAQMTAKDNQRMSTQDANLNSLRPGNDTQAAGAYSTAAGYDPRGNQRQSTGDSNRTALRPSASNQRPGGYSTSDFSLLPTLRSTTGDSNINSIRAGADGQRPGSYSTSQFDVLPTLRSTTGDSNINSLRAGADGQRPGSYSTSQFDVLPTLRSTTGDSNKNSLRAGADGQRPGAFSTSQVDPRMTQRTTTHGANVNALIAHNSTRGTFTGADQDFHHRGGRKATMENAYSINAGIGHDTTADVRLGERINDSVARTTLKETTLGAFYMRAPMVEQSRPINFPTQNELPPFSRRRVTPDVEQVLDPALLTPLLSNPYASPCPGM